MISLRISCIKLISAFSAALLILTGCSSKSSSSEKYKVKTLTVSDIKDLNGGKEPEIEYAYNSDRIDVITGDKLSNVVVKNEADAMGALKEFADIMGSSDPENELRFNEKHQINGGYYYNFDQFYNGMIVNGSAQLSVDHEGNVTRVSNNYISGIDISTEPKYSAEFAANFAERNYDAKISGEPELMVYSLDGRIRPVWLVHLESSSYPDKLYIDAINGTLASEDGPIN